MGNKSSGGPRFHSVRSDDSDSNNEAKLEKIRSAKEDFELGNVEFLRGNCESASSLYRHAIEKIHSGQQNEHEHELVVATSNLGVQTFAEGRYDAAKALLDEAIERSNILNNLGCCCEMSGDLAEAAAFYEEGLKLRQVVFGDRSIEAAESMQNLATVCDAQDNLVQAGQLLTDALSIEEQVYGIDDICTACTLNNLGVHYARLHELDTALQYLRRSYHIRVAKLGQDHPDTACAERNLRHVRDRM
ncbi:hypothetical protein B484DRAFT_396073 [Ochromonadaceae sp. CCMP2298]|nr:hypothetical protein B484DRAFT_396073 [Ochromonadaceae sp. CCMP2298]